MTELIRAACRVILLALDVLRYLVVQLSIQVRINDRLVEEVKKSIPIAVVFYLMGEGCISYIRFIGQAIKQGLKFVNLDVIKVNHNIRDLLEVVSLGESLTYREVIVVLINKRA
jgi:hypothetical protein